VRHKRILAVTTAALLLLTIAGASVLLFRWSISEKQRHTVLLSVQHTGLLERVIAIDTRSPQGEVEALLEQSLAPLFTDATEPGADDTSGRFHVLYWQNPSEVVSPKDFLAYKVKITAVRFAAPVYRVQRTLHDGNRVYFLEKRTFDLDNGSAEIWVGIRSLARSSSMDANDCKSASIGMLLSDIQYVKQALIERSAVPPEFPAHWTNLNRVN